MSAAYIGTDTPAALARRRLERALAVAELLARFPATTTPRITAPGTMARRVFWLEAAHIWTARRLDASEGRAIEGWKPAVVEHAKTFLAFRRNPA